MNNSDKPIKISYFYLTLFMFFVAIIVVVIIEVSVRLFYPETRLDKITKIIEPHSIRFWRGKASFKDKFFDAYVEHNSLGLRAREDISNTDLLVLGASPSYGWGVEFNEIYSSLLERKLNTLKKDVKVTNASSIGYSSFQGNLLLKELLEISKPKIVLIAYVINDVDRYRFFSNNHLSDVEVEHNESGDTRQFIENNYFTGKLLRNLLSSEEKLPTPGKVRVNETEYRKNISEMIKAVKSVGGIPILLKMPVMLHENNVSLDFQNYLRSINCKQFLNSDEKLYNCLKNNESASRYMFSENELRKVMAMNSSRRTVEYHNILDRLAEKYKISIINPVRAFRESDEYLFLHENLDPIHPNPKGHKIISELIYNEIIKKNLL
jgi:lysophospholipase L1-like esterase